jgi:molybdenum-dependent DNA-binding transcriptional regulator ModE
MRAWSLIQTINACFKEPVITAARGGNERTDRRGNGSVGGADALRHVQGGGQDDAD